MFLLQHLDENVQNLESHIEGAITERDKIFNQLEHSNPFETL